MRPAEAVARTEPAGAAGRLLVFTVAGQELAIPIDPIVEIAPYRKPTPVPGAGPGIQGLLALRGRMVTVIDLRQRLGLEAQGEEAAGRVIVLRDEGELIGLTAGSGARVVPLEARDRQPLPVALRLKRPDLFEGALPRGDGGYVLVLDLPALLRSDR